LNVIVSVISGIVNIDALQIRFKKIFKRTAMQVLYFFLDKISKLFDVSHAFLPLTIEKLSTFKNGPVFWAHPVGPIGLYRERFILQGSALVS